MDTRSVIRSRRQSARLHQQPSDDKASKQSMPNRRVSDTDVSRTRTKSATSKPAIPKAATIKRAQSATKSSPNVTPEPPAPAKSSTKNGEHGADSPIFPNLAPTKNMRLDGDNVQRHPDTALSRNPLAEASDNIGTENRGSRVRVRWVKTAQSAMRLVDDTPYNASLGATTQSEETPDGAASSMPENRRRSARLAGSTPGVEEIKMPVANVDPKTTQSTSLEEKSVAPTTPLKEDLAVESQRPAYKVSSASSSDSSLTDLDDLPPYSNLPFADDPDEEVDFAERTSPIPDLVADIARIIETSSPIAARACQSNTSNIATPAEPSAVETTVTTALASESAGVAGSPTEAVHKVDYTSLAQATTADPLLHGSTLGETSRVKYLPGTIENNAPPERAATPDTVTATQCQEDSPRGIKRPAEDMSHDDQTPKRNQHVGSSSRPSLLVTPTRTVNLIESASSRDCYDAEGDELGSPGAGLWLDGETDESQPRRQSDLPRVADQITVRAGEHNPADSQYRAGHLPYLQDIMKCSDCGKTPQRCIVCVKCLKACYCGKYCQIWNWPIHRRSCQASEEANPGEVKRQEEFLEGMWAGALRVLKQNVTEWGSETDGERKDQAVLQAIVDSSFMDRGAGENIVEQGVRLLGGGAEAVAAEDGAGQQGRGGMSSHEIMGGSVMADQHVDEDVQDKEGAVFKMPPPSPESMFRSRAMALRLAQAAEV